MINKIQEIASQNPYGFTISLKNLTPITSGIVVAYAATQNSHDLEGLKKCLEHAAKNAGVIGGWLDTQSNKYYFDSVRVFKNREQAISFGKAQKQIAIFDLDNLEEIRLI